METDREMGRMRDRERERGDCLSLGILIVQDIKIALSSNLELLP